ncbi:MAG: cytochrome ubiquinol oxidase subunit I [Actinobacteria bacterium]|jgi:cytochrome d ubiquinol oxidase subunit I|nr:cytochrome ubiquinol oxidase subunit I [Actinomycetota bacterium]MCO5299990.1 cytochrome ubiquinol oxidase subunit I [Candidatus Nanopelagicales bacterium]MCB9429811.1 cytochrome ubiquinol oxidase subunit I [Actinomycetota bacterium]HPE11835.1 cytochrome ubiquinol oxidase subunit I [Actinomycetota bacterium]HPQ83815.1 cytochrome ubiquinol oxidase subunit I [Actinomycetota bacterium]
MNALDLSRWQFAITTVYHFLFVPITIGTSFLVAGMQTAWYRTGNEKWLRATKFFGKLFLINFAMGVVTGIVQEFQFGMNWSDYSRFVGDIFGAPLAIEGLLAFFLESTFLGLWIFGWDRLPKKLHLATIWLAAIGTVLSAYFILAANSFMQNPVGYEINPQTQRAEMTDIGQVLGQPLAIITFTHVITMAFLVSGLFVAGISAWLLFKGRSLDVVRSTLKLGSITALVAFVLTGITGDAQATKMVEVQPMKMAAAEALYETAAPAPFSIFTIGTLDGSEPIFSIDIPHGLSLLATHSWDGEVQGINNLQAQYEEQFGPGDYRPNIPMAYWNFRLMIGFGALGALIAAWMLWVTRKDRIPTTKWFPRLALFSIILPLLGSSTGWIFTEMGRQPWVVFGLMQTQFGVSPTVTVAQVLTSMIVFTLLYGALAVVEVGLLMRAVKIGPPDSAEHSYPDKLGEDRPLTVTY